jgi:hypothetical protein
MALPEYRSRGSANASTGTINPGLPTGIEIGDLLVYLIETSGPTTTAGQEATNVPTSTGWTQLLSEKNGNTRLTILYQIAASTTPTRTSSDTGNHQLGNIAAFKKGTFNAENPFHKTAITTLAKTKSLVYPTLETKIAECLVLNASTGNLPDAGTEAEFGAPTNASLSSPTERFDYTTEEGDGGSLHLVSGGKAVAGSVTATTSTAVTEAERVLATVAITPLGGKEEESKSATVEPPAASASAAALAPTVTTTQNVTVEPPAAAATASAPVPTVSAGIDATVSPPAAAVVASAPAPTVTTTSSVVIEPPTAVSSASALVPTVEGETPVPPARVAVSREYPPDQLAIRVDPPKAAPSRWAADEPLLENVATDIQLTDDEHGDKEGTWTLARNPRTPWPDLAAYSEISVYGPGVEEVGSYRLDKAPESDGERMVISPAAVGHQALLDDDTAVVGPGFIDQRLDKWTGPSAQRKIDNGQSWDQSSSPGIDVDPSGVVPQVNLTSTGKINKPIWLAMYDAGPGIRIERIAAAIEAVNLAPGGIDPNVNTGLYATDDDRFSGLEVLGDVSAGGGFSYAVANKRYVVFQGSYGATEGGEDGKEYGYRLAKLIVLGATGLVLQGEWPNVGFTADQMLGYTVPLSGLKADPEDIEDAGYVVQQAWYGDPGSLRAVVDDLCKYDPYVWFVFGNKRFQRRQPGTFGREWIASAGPSGLSEAGLDSSRLWRSIVVSYTDVDGTTKTVGPIGSGADVETGNLEITDPDHPAVRAEVTRKDLLSLNTIATPTRAIEAGERFLVEANQLSRSGSGTLSGYVQDSRGVFWPASQVRVYDRVRFPGASDPSARLVVGRNYDHPTRTVQVALDAPPEGQAALLERMQADISALQLA